jgi:hypothetical protein
LHPPQLAGSIVSSMHGPPVVHCTMESVPLAAHAQAPLLQMAPCAHFFPHEPQLFGSFCALTHIATPFVPGQSVVVPTHVQMPPLLDPGWHVTVDGQVRPHPLQLFGS